MAYLDGFLGCRLDSKIYRVVDDERFHQMGHELLTTQSEAHLQTISLGRGMQAWA